VHRFALNIAQKRLAAGLCLNPLGSLQRSPKLPSWINRERRGGEGKRREGVREGKEGCYPPPLGFSGYTHAGRTSSLA